MLHLKQELLRCNMAKDQLEGENVRFPFYAVTTCLTGVARTHALCWFICFQAELKHKLSERDKLISDYEVLHIIAGTLMHLLNT